SARLSAARAALQDEERRVDLATALAEHDAAADLAIQAELAADRPSPQAWRERRRALQMARLAEKLGGTARAGDDVGTLWREWLALPGTGSTARADLDTRIEAALAHLFDG